MWAAVGLGDVQVDEQSGDGFGSHAGATIGMQRQGARFDVVFLYGVGNKLLGEFSRFSCSQHPTDDVAAKNIHYYVELVCLPFHRTLYFCDIPAPHLPWSDREQLRLGIDRMDSLTTAFACLIPAGQQPVHGTD